MAWKRGEELADLAEGQNGLFTTAQAQARGVARPTLQRMLRNGAIQRQLHGVYSISGAPHDPFTDLRAAWLSLDPKRTAWERLGGDPHGVVSHRSATAVLGVGELDADRHEFTTQQRYRSRNPEIRMHRGDPGEWQVHEGLPVTTPGQTIATLAQGRLDLDHLASIIMDSTRRWGLTRAELETCLGPVARDYGHSDVDDLLDDILTVRGDSLERALALLGRRMNRHPLPSAASEQMGELTKALGSLTTAVEAQNREIGRVLRRAAAAPVTLERRPAEEHRLRATMTQKGATDEA